MAKYRVLITDYPWADLDVERAGLAAAEAELVESPATDEQTLVSLAAGVDGILTTWAPTTAAVINASPDLKIVSRLGIGLDNIDVAACTARRIPVTNVPGYCSAEVAEHALASIFALGRNLPWHHARTKAGRYDLQSGPVLRRLEGQSVGIVGLGRIGRRLAEKCLGVGFRVLAVDRGERIPGVTYVAFSEVLRRSDYVSLHLPLDQSTRDMIGRDELKLMKRTAFLINTARGGLIDHSALSWALTQGEIAGAALDVQSPEPPDLEAAPYCDERVLVTPHMAFISEQSLLELRRRGVENVCTALRGQKPPHVVNGEIWSA